MTERRMENEGLTLMEAAVLLLEEKRVISTSATTTQFHSLFPILRTCICISSIISNYTIFDLSGSIYFLLFRLISLYILFLHSLFCRSTSVIHEYSCCSDCFEVQMTEVSILRSILIQSYPPPSPF